MNSDNPMIVGGRSLPVPGSLNGLFIGEDDRSHKVSLSIDGSRKDYQLNSRNRPLLMIGRSKRCDIVLPHAKVSTRHAYLKLIGNQIYCVDLVSRNGTYWGNRHRNAGWLKVGRPISIHPFSIAALSIDDVELEDVVLPDVDLLKKQDYDRLPCRAELTFINSRPDDGRSSRWKIVRPITILGSSPRCKMHLDDFSVSRVHCSLIVTPSGLWVIDLLSNKGTLVNGERVDFHLLRENDEVQIGCFRFVVSYQGFTESNFYESLQPLSTPQQPQIQQETNRGTGFSENFVLSLVDRFAAMQQQAALMNQQQMMSMLQLMGTMHQNHHDLVQRELTRIHQIDSEIQQIQSRVAAGTANFSPVSPVEAHVVLPETVTPLPAARVSFEADKPATPAEMKALQHFDAEPAPVAESEPDLEIAAELEAVIDPDCDLDLNASESTCSPVSHEAAVDDIGLAENSVAQPVDELEVKDEIETREVASAVRTDQQEVRQQPVQTTPPAVGDVADDSADAHVEESTTKSEFEPDQEIEEVSPVLPRSQENQSTPLPDANDHLGFIERLATLERERNSRWKKIMRMLTGSGD